MTKPTWEDTPEYEAALAKLEQERVEERKSKAAEKPKVEADRAKALGPLHKAVALATAKLEKVQQALTVAQGEFNQAKLAVYGLNATADAAIDRLDAALREDAIPGIKEFLDGIYAVWEHERRRWQWMAPLDAKGEPMKARARMDQIASIRKRAEGLYFEPDSEVAESELERLKTEIKLPTAVAA